MCRALIRDTLKRMGGVTLEKLLVIGLIAAVLIGPERLPQFASGFARIIKGLQVLASGAKERMREEMGPEFDEVDWKSFDPRRYDPRTIVRDALFEDSAVAPTSGGGGAREASAVGDERVRPPQPLDVLPITESPRFDSEAT